MKALLIALALLGPGHASPHNYTVPAAHPKGTIMVVHGGGWVGVGRSLMGASQDAWLHRQGWTLRVVDYRPGRQSLPDVIAAWDSMRVKPTCVYGASAGGHLAELLALVRPVKCVIAESAPQDLPTLSGLAAPFAAQVWGADEATFSPARYALHTHLLAVDSTADAVVNGREQLARLSTGRKLLLRSGSYNFTHTGITARALKRYRKAMVRVLT